MLTYGAVLFHHAAKRTFLKHCSSLQQHVCRKSFSTHPLYQMHCRFRNAFEVPALAHTICRNELSCGPPDESDRHSSPRQGHRQKVGGLTALLAHIAFVQQRGESSNSWPIR